MLVLVGVLLKNGKNDSGSTDNVVLFTDLKQEEAKEIVRILQDEGVSYQQEENGTIRVDASKADAVRAELLSKGYPQSGFTYDMYLGNTGLMTTESDKKQYTLYELQDRLGATISLFEGVRDAKVTIATDGEDKYVLDQEKKDAKASVVVTMKKENKLSAKNANAIRQLIARSVKGLNFTDVSVFDAETMMEIGSDEESEDVSDLASKIENILSGKVSRVLGKIYGPENVVVSVKGKVNMEKLLSESTKYSVPEKIDKKDKTGLLHTEKTEQASAGSEDAVTGGVAGTDSNADEPRYTERTGEGTTKDGYSEGKTDREWLYDVVKEQKEIKPGTLEDVSVAVAIKTDDTTIKNNELQTLIADAVGISREDAANRISVLKYPLNQEDDSNAPKAGKKEGLMSRLPLPVLIGLGAALLVLILLIVLLIRRKKKKAEEAESPDSIISTPEENDDLEDRKKVLEEQMKETEAMAHMGAELGEKLNKSVGEFVDQNPQDAAELIQTWMKGGAEEDGKR